MALSKIQAESMNLADTYAFTGTVSGAGETNDMKLVETTTVTSSNVASVDFENLSTDYNHFIIKIGDFKPTSNGS